jgi:hypothetical protein
VESCLFPFGLNALDCDFGSFLGSFGTVFSTLPQLTDAASGRRYQSSQAWDISTDYEVSATAQLLLL